MSGSTGPIVALTAIQFGNHWILNKQGPDFKILLGGAVAAGALALAEHIPAVGAPLATGIAWIALVTTLFTRIGGKPSPAENLLKVSGL